MKIHLISNFALLALSGCVSIVPNLGFDYASDQMRNRAKVEIYWNQGDAADKQIKDRIKSLLSKPITSDSAVQIALLNNRSVQSFYEDLNIAQADLVEAGLFSNPLLNGEIRFPREGTNFELSVVQNLIAILQIPLRKKIASAKFEEAKIHLVNRLIDLSTRTRLNFFEYQGAEQRLDIVRKALDSLEASAILAKKLHDAGNINTLDLQQEQATYESLKLEIALLEQEVLQRREKLNSLLGIWQGPYAWSLEKRLPQPIPHNLKIEQIESSVISSSTELAEARKEILALASELGMASDFALFSSNDSGISGSKEAEADYSGFGPAFSMAIPLFNQGQPSIFRANAKLKKKLESYYDLAVSTRADARALTGKLTLAHKRAEYFKNILLPLKISLVSEYQKQYNGMLIGAFQLLAAKRDEIKAAQDYIESLEDYWRTHTKLTALIYGKNFMEN